MLRSYTARQDERWYGGWVGDRLYEYMYAVVLRAMRLVLLFGLVSHASLYSFADHFIFSYRLSPHHRLIIYIRETRTMNINEPNPSAQLALPFTKAANPKSTYTQEQLRMPLVHKVPDSIRNHFIAMCGEFVGTVLFLYFALSGAQVANSIPSSAGLTVEQTGSNPQQLQYIALCFGFSLAVNAWV